MASRNAYPLIKAGTIGGLVTNIWSGPPPSKHGFCHHRVTLFQTLLYMTTARRTAAAAQTQTGLGASHIPEQTRPTTAIHPDPVVVVVEKWTVNCSSVFELILFLW